MGVTAHWIEAQPQEQKKAQRPQLTLQADLIGFVHIPGRHTGADLAHAFLHVLDRINVAEKVYIPVFSLVTALLLILFIRLVGSPWTMRLTMTPLCLHWSEN